MMDGADIRFLCPGCRRAYSVPEAQAGRKGDCPCGAFFEIPAAPGEPAPPGPEPAAQPSGEPARPPHLPPSAPLYGPANPRPFELRRSLASGSLGRPSERPAPLPPQLTRDGARSNWPTWGLVVLGFIVFKAMVGALPRKSDVPAPRYRPPPTGAFPLTEYAPEPVVPCDGVVFPQIALPQRPRLDTCDLLGAESTAPPDRLAGMVRFPQGGPPVEPAGPSPFEAGSSFRRRMAEELAEVFGDRPVTLVGRPDGAGVAWLWLRPAVTGREGLPVVVCLSPTGAASERVTELSRWVGQGYAVALRVAGTGEPQFDARLMLRWVAEQPTVQPGRLYLVGGTAADARAVFDCIERDAGLAAAAVFLPAGSDGPVGPAGDHLACPLLVGGSSDALAVPPPSAISTRTLFVPGGIGSPDESVAWQDRARRLFDASVRGRPLNLEPPQSGKLTGIEIGRFRVYPRRCRPSSANRRTRSAARCGLTAANSATTVAAAEGAIRSNARCSRIGSAGSASPAASARSRAARCSHSASSGSGDSPLRPASVVHAASSASPGRSSTTSAGSASSGLSSPARSTARRAQSRPG